MPIILCSVAFSNAKSVNGFSDGTCIMRWPYNLSCDMDPLSMISQLYMTILATRNVLEFFQLLVSGNKLDEKLYGVRDNGV